MGRTSFHVDPDDAGRVIAALRDEGFDVEPGNGPMVDWRVE